MLNLGSKFKFLFFCFVFIFSCNNENNVDYENISKSIVGEKEYLRINNMITDSLQLWYKNKLGYYQYNFGNSKFLHQDILCFNKSKNKFVSALLQRHINIDDNSDGIDFFYGAKIDSNWYFFTGAYIVLPREMYQKDVTKPLSFEKLHEIALKEVFSGYLKKKKTWKFWKPVEYEVNERFFDQICPKAVGGRHFGTYIHFEDAVKCNAKALWANHYNIELPECNKDPKQYPIFGVEGYYDFVYESDLKWLIENGYCDKNGQLIKKYEKKFNRP